MKRSTPNDSLNLLIVAGLFVIALSVVLAMAVIYAQTKTVQSEFVLIVSNIAAGLVGFLSREYRLQPPQGDTTTVASSVSVTSPVDSDDK
jgi:hypothetical protein